MKMRLQIGATILLLVLALAGPASAQCVGDCEDDGEVTVDELIKGVNIALGTADISICTAFDNNEDGQVTVDELVTGVNNALNGCSVGPTETPGPTPTPTVGGEEIDIVCELGEGAGAALQTTLFPVPIPVQGRLILTAGTLGEGGEVPLRIKKGGMDFDPVSVPGLVCACVRGGELPAFEPGNVAEGSMGCGEGGLADVDYLTQVDHITNDVDPNCVLGELEDGSGEQPHTGVCNGPETFEITGDGPTGSVFLEAGIAISLIQDGGVCTANCSIPDMGPDCLPCTEDDVGQDIAEFVRLITGTAEGVVIDADNRPGALIRKDVLCGASLCNTELQGVPANCENFAADPNNTLSGAKIVGALVEVDSASIGDNVVTFNFSCEE